MEEQLSGSLKKIWKDIRRILISHREKELFHMNSLEYLKEEMRTKLDHIVSIKQLQHVYKKHVNISTEDLKNRILYENKRYASTFIGQEKDILSMIKKLILEDPYIAEDLRGMVLSDDPDPIFLQGELSHNVKGIWYGSNRKERQWIYGPVECSEFIICFGKQENGGKGWDIKSAYPVPKNYYPVLITSI